VEPPGCDSLIIIEVLGGRIICLTTEIISRAPKAPKAGMLISVEYALSSLNPGVAAGSFGQQLAAPQPRQAAQLRRNKRNTATNFLNDGVELKTYFNFGIETPDSTPEKEELESLTSAPSRNSSSQIPHSLSSSVPSECLLPPTGGKEVVFRAAENRRVRSGREGG
jgi:hypothetical protein